MEFEGLGRVVGTNVRSAREAAGLSQDELASRLQSFGLDWSRNFVANLESRHREPTVSEFLLLAAALNLRPAELLGVPKELQVPGPSSTTGEEGRASIWRAEIPADLLPGLLYGRGYKHLTVWDPEMKPTEAERAAARHLGLAVAEVQDFAFRLWGRRLDHERDERAGHPTGSGAHMKKAHVTRKLQDELRAEVRKRGLLHDHGDQDTKSGGRKEKRP